ncbi:MAG TPA: 3-phosphoshikimate 1-carboxyvinyltransferase [Acidimicrobiales bacterium]|nr:3-phosphoshikimate 1-carboxyvinyltransferase [Acidimicrobiales bacterium]
MSGTAPETATFSESGPLRGVIRVPGDKSIAHRALICAALASGTSWVHGLPRGDDVARTRGALGALGVYFDGETVVGGRERLREPDRPIDLGNSASAVRLLAGVCATLPFHCVLDGDASVRRRPMDRVVEPLRAMGAGITGAGGDKLAPLDVRGGALVGIDYTSPVASSQVKGAVLFAGLDAEGETVLREAVPTRRHTEELFARCGAAMDVEDGAAGYAVRVRRSALVPFEVEIPGDPSQAAFLAVAASLVAGSEVRIEHVYCGPGRLGFVDVLRRMGAAIEVVPRDAMTGDLLVRHAPLDATTISGAEIPALIDELPVLAVAAAYADGVTTITDAAELRVKESDRIATMAAELAVLGAEVQELPDGLVIRGGGFAPRGTVSSHGDHRVAMALAVAGLGPSGAVEIRDFAATAVTWPGFLEDLRSLA